MLHALMEAAPYLALLVVGVAMLALAGIQSDADEHDLSDYHEQLPASPPPKSSRAVTVTVKVARRARRVPLPLPFEMDELDDILPAAPPGMNAGSPLYAGMLFDTWHPETPEAVAARFLRELRAEAVPA